MAALNHAPGASRLAPVRWAPLVPLALWAAVIFTLSSIPNPPDAGGGDWRYNLAHLFEYTVFGALAFYALRCFRPSAPAAALVFLAWTLGTLYGMSDEFHQSFVPNRDANWLDVGLDSLGSFIGASALALRSRVLR